MKSWRLTLLLFLIFSSFFLFPKKIVFAVKPPFNSSQISLFSKVTKEPIKEIARGLNKESQEERVLSASSPEEEPSDLEKQIVKDLLEEKPSLQSLLRQYYFYRHHYNEKAGVNALLWLGRAALWDPAKTVWTTLLGIKNLFKVYELYESIRGFLEMVGEIGTLSFHGDLEDAATLIGLNMPDERFPIPFASLFLGINKQEFLRWRAGSLYKEVLEKLKEEDPNYCVFQETWGGKNYCYKSWFEYWKEFRPASMLSPVPRGLEEYNKAALRWQRMTKFGEFSDGKKYTVKELTGENWQDAFEDMNWTPQRYEIPIFKQKDKAEVSPTLISPSITLLPEEWPPSYLGAQKIGNEYKNKRKPEEKCQAYGIKGDAFKISEWYREKMKTLGWEIVFDDQFIEFKKGEKRATVHLMGEYDWEKIFDLTYPGIEGKRQLEKEETGLVFCWLTSGKGTPVSSLTSKPEVKKREINVALKDNGGKATADSYGSYAGVHATADKGNDGNKDNFWGGTI